MKDRGLRVACTLCVVMLLLALTGCSSISGYYLERDADGNVTGTQEVHGLPIVVQTPTRAAFVLTRSEYSATRTVIETSAAGEIVSKTTQLPNFSEATLSEEPIMLGPSEVFTIDPIRPFSGSIDYQMEFENQYPKKMAGKVDDKTFEGVANFLRDMVDKGLKPGGISKESGADESITRTLVMQEVSLVIIDLKTGEVTIKSLTAPDSPGASGRPR